MFTILPLWILALQVICNTATDDAFLQASLTSFNNRERKKNTRKDERNFHSPLLEPYFIVLIHSLVLITPQVYTYCVTLLEETFFFFFPRSMI